MLNAGSYGWQALISLCIILRLLYVKQLKDYLDTEVNNASVMMRALRSISKHRETDSTETDMKQGKNAHFSDVLKDEEGFKIFANHLLKEYSVLSVYILSDI